MSLLAGEPTWNLDRSRGRTQGRSAATLFPLKQEEHATKMEADNASNYVIARCVLPKPVYIRDGQLAYRTSEMEQDRLYKIGWNGEDYALKKTGRGVEIFRFHPDENVE